MWMNTSPSRAASAAFSSGVRSADASNSTRSAPEQKSFPAPRTTTTLTVESRSAVSSSVSNASIMSVSMALRLSGRFSRSVSTPFSPS